MIYKSKLWINDIDTIIKTIPELNKLNGKSILVTGATGLICSVLVDIFIRYNEFYNGNIKIIATSRQIEKLNSRFGKYCKKDYFESVIYDASSNNNIIKPRADYIIHGASNAYPSLLVKKPIETMLDNFLGTKNLLDYANRCKTRRILFISSSEIYGQKENSDPYSEEEYGYIDLANYRNSYAVSKRAAETLLASYQLEHGINYVVARPGHVYGPTASPEDNRVSSSFAYLAAKGEDIIMKSDGSQLRSYCYAIDCAAAILKILIKGKNGNAYNISNPKSVITIKEMAEILANAGGVEMRIQVPSKEEKKAFNPMTNSALDSSKLQSLGWQGQFDAKSGLEHTVKILKDMLKMPK